MTVDEAARTAREAGLTRFLDEHPEEFRAALRAAAGLAQRLPRNLSPGEEPAHILDLSKTPESSQ